MNRQASKLSAAGLFLLVFFGLAGQKAFTQEQKYDYVYQGRRDPFIPLISPAGYLLNLEPQEDSALRLEGIIYDAKGNSIAIINGELVKVGERIGEVVVSSIEENKIIVIQDNEKTELELRREE